MASGQVVKLTDGVTTINGHGGRLRSTSTEDEGDENGDNDFASFEDGEDAKIIDRSLKRQMRRKGVDPRAIAISFKQLAENHPNAELEIVAMEKRGLDKFLLRAKTAPDADKSQLSQEYFDTYNEIKALPEQEIKLLIEENQ